VGQGPELGQDEGLALVLGKALKVGDHVAQVLATLDLRREPLDGGLGHVVERPLLALGAQQRETAVAGDRVEPGLELDRLGRAGEVAVGGDERVLDDVLGLLAGADHVPCEGEDASVVAVEDRLERSVVAGAEQPHELVVASEAESSARPPDGGCGLRRDGGGHGRRVDTPSQRAPLPVVGV
jgi:hypothetical protein